MIICKECKQEKNESQFYKHPLTKSGRMGRCIECVLKGRKTEHEIVLARERDRQRYANNYRRRLYSVWRGMNSRCYDPSNSHYKRYGKKGIKVLRERFDDFYSDMILSYTEHCEIFGKDRKSCQIDRIDNNGDYCKSNCRRVTAKENNETNKKKLSSWIFSPNS